MSRETLEHEGRFMSSGVAIAEDAPNRVSAVSDFARSAMFERTFQDGMALVEDTAAYLDGAGRQEARSLARSGALAYANCSMRLTTQLMQVASWLLVQRAVREGDMAAAEACEARYRLGTAATEDLVVDVEATDPPSDDAWSLPPGILGLMDRAQRLYERVSHLDRRMHLNEDSDAANPLASHMDRLRAAFGG